MKQRLQDNSHLRIMSNKKYQIGKNSNEITERIEELRIDLGYKKKKNFCDTIGFPTSSYSNITGTRDSKPNIELLSQIALKFPNVNFRWILTGIGGKYLEDKIGSENNMVSEDSQAWGKAEKTNIIEMLQHQVKGLEADKERQNQLVDRLYAEPAALTKKIKKNK